MSQDTNRENEIFATPRVAVIGAGIAGLTAARRLLDHGCLVEVFEKSRGTGGRAATRRAEPPLAFDHGAQYFTAYDAQFRQVVEDWLAKGVVARWPATLVQIGPTGITPKVDQPERFVGVPGMSAIGRHLAQEIAIRGELRIKRLERHSERWRLIDESGQDQGRFDQVVVAVPAPQAVDLLENHPLAEQARAVPMTPCWAAMVAFERRVEADWDGAFVQESPLAWVARNSAKPGRAADAECWVLHATADWTVAHLDLSKEAAATMLLEAFSKTVANPLPPIVHLDAHRWMFSATPLTLDRQCLGDSATRIAVCGDWLAGGRIEGAYRSGIAAANFVLRAAGRFPSDDQMANNATNSP